MNLHVATAPRSNSSRLFFVRLIEQTSTLIYRQVRASPDPWDTGDPDCHERSSDGTFCWRSPQRLASPFLDQSSHTIQLDTHRRSNACYAAQAASPHFFQTSPNLTQITAAFRRWMPARRQIRSRSRSRNSLLVSIHDHIRTNPLPGAAHSGSVHVPPYVPPPLLQSWRSPSAPTSNENCLLVLHAAAKWILHTISVPVTPCCGGTATGHVPTRSRSQVNRTTLPHIPAAAARYKVAAARVAPHGPPRSYTHRTSCVRRPWRGAA